MSAQPTYVAHFFRHRAQAEDLGDRRAALAQPIGHRFVRVAVALGQRLQSVRLFERAQVLALQVLDEGDLHRFRIRCLAHDAGHLAQPRLDGRAIAPLSRDDLEPRAARADQDRLEHALLAHGRDQLREIAHVLARLMRIGIDVFDRHHAPHGLAAGTSELIDEVHVVTHAQCFRQTDPSWARHVR